MGKILSGFLVGENSHKREIGLVAFAVLQIALFLDWITPELYDAMFPLIAMWTGVAYSAKLSKVHKAIQAADETNYR